MQTGSKNTAPVGNKSKENALILQAVAKEKGASFDDFRQNINAFFAEFKNQMREIILFQLP